MNDNPWVLPDIEIGNHDVIVQAELVAVDDVDEVDEVRIGLNVVEGQVGHLFLLGVLGVGGGEEILLVTDGEGLGLAGFDFVETIDLGAGEHAISGVNETDQISVAVGGLAVEGEVVGRVDDLSGEAGGI